MPAFALLREPRSYLPGLWDFNRDVAARETWSRRLRTHFDDTLRYARGRESLEIVGHLETIAPRWLAVLDTLADPSAPPPTAPRRQPLEATPRVATG